MSCYSIKQIGIGNIWFCVIAESPQEAVEVFGRGIGLALARNGSSTSPPRLQQIEKRPQSAAG